MVDIKEALEPAFQLRRYAYTAKLPLSILTDFEEFAIYDTRIKPNQKDKASVARIFYCKYDEYLSPNKTDHEKTNLEYINAIFSKGEILKGSFKNFIDDTKRKSGTSEVDKEFLKLIESWRTDLAKNIAIRNKDLDVYNLNTAVQKIIDRIIFLRIAEDRHMEKYGALLAISKEKNVYQRLDEFFQKADGKYNSGLFLIFDWISNLVIDDKVLSTIIQELYPPGCPYEFSVLPIEILGNIYEQFLGKTIRLTPSHQAKVEEKPEVRKAGGVYYTPQYIVDYIVENTVGALLNPPFSGSTTLTTSKGGLPPQKIEKIRILDPACGSGSFLVGAFDYLLKYHIAYYSKPANLKKAMKGGKIYRFSENTFRLSIQEKQRILLNNIYGVDIDHQAVEVTKLSLLLKLMENEQVESSGELFKHSDLKLLPDLSDNIRCGNSLIGSDFYADKELSLFGKEEMRKVNAFDWDKEFPEVFPSAALREHTGTAHESKGKTNRSVSGAEPTGWGFDCVIGNPPWGSDLSQTEKDYLSNLYPTFFGNFDSYLFFIEKSLKLLKINGSISLITPDTWIRVPQSIKLREYVLNEFEISLITTLPIKVFDNVSANCIIFVINNRRKNKSCVVNIMNPKSTLSILSNKNFDDSYPVNTSYWKNSSDFQFQIFQKENVLKLIYKLKNNYNDAINYLDVMQGIVPYSRENHSNETVEKRLFHSTKKLSDDYGLWIKGRAITRYSIDLGNPEYIKYGSWLHRPRKKKYFQGDRILIQEITGGNPPRISACYYNDIVYQDPGIISCLNNSNFHIFFFRNYSVSFGINGRLSNAS